MTNEGELRFDLHEIGAEPLEDDDPRRIGAFPIRAVLGSGGMGRVYLGLAPDGYTAVKRVLPYLANDKIFLRHFGQELDNQARLPAGISARLLAADRTARPPWFATEYVPGITLHDAVYLSGGSLPTSAVWVLLRELSKRLRTVAALDIMHRDLKPSNVMLTAEGLTLIDFGVARAADQSSVTATGMAVGTPTYMAPEQARAVKTLTPAVDVFALGGVLTFAATGVPPFGEGAGADLFYRIVHQEPDLMALRALDPTLADVIADCLEKDPAGRPSAFDLAELAAAHANPGPPTWPGVVASRIEIRRSFAAAAAPVSEATQDTGVDPEVTEFEEPAGPDVAELADAEAETERLAEPEPREERRFRRTLAILLPVVLLAGTAGTLVALNKVPWVTDSSGNNPGTHTLGSATSAADASGSPRSTKAAGGSGTPGPARSGSASHAPGGATPGPSSSGSARAGGGTNSGGSGGNGGGVPTSAPVTHPSTPHNPPPQGPSGPGSDPNLLSGSVMSVSGCEGWMDFSTPVFTATISAGSPASCAGTASSTFMSQTSTAGLSAANGKKASVTSCGSGCWYVGAYTITAKLCVWNTDDTGDAPCVEYTYDSTTNKVTED